MAILTAGNFRTGSLTEFTYHFALSTTDVEDDDLITAAITRLTERFQNYTNDRFESAAQTLTTEGNGTDRLFLPERTTAVSQVRVRDEDGTWTVQTAGVYRLRSSLDSAGAERVKGREYDWLEIVPNGDGLDGYPGSHPSPYSWPSETGSVEVTATVGWTTTPADVKRALALLVYHHFKPLRKDLGLAAAVTNANERIEYAVTEPTGIPECDQIIADYRRESFLAVA